MRWGFGVGALVAAGLLAVVVFDDTRDARTKKLGSDTTRWSIPVVDEAEAATLEGQTEQKTLPRYGWRQGRRWNRPNPPQSETGSEAEATSDEATPVASPASDTAGPIAQTKTKDQRPNEA